MKKNILETIKITFLALILTVGIGYAFAAWTPAPASPPSGNVDAPINVGATSQAKLGALSLGTISVPTPPALLRLDCPAGDCNNKVLTSDASGNASWQNIQVAQAFRRDIQSGGQIITLLGDSAAFVSINNILNPSNGDPDLMAYTGLDGIGCATGWSLTGCWIVTVGDDADVFPYQNGCITNDMDQGRSTVSISCIKTTPTINTLILSLGGYCYGSPAYPTSGATVTWTAGTNGAGPTYSWSGAGITSGTGGSTVTKTYSSSGTQTATVVISAGGQSITRSCSVTVESTPPPSDPGDECGGGTGILCN